MGIDRRPDRRIVAGLVAEAYREVASPRLIAELDRPRKQGEARLARRLARFPRRPRVVDPR